MWNFLGTNPNLIGREYGEKPIKSHMDKGLSNVLSVGKVK